jgi:hypothetical protein
LVGWGITNDFVAADRFPLSVMPVPDSPAVKLTNLLKDAVAPWSVPAKVTPPANLETPTTSRVDSSVTPPTTSRMPATSTRAPKVDPVEAYMNDVVIPALAVSSLENDPVVPLKVPENVTPPAALIPLGVFTNPYMVAEVCEIKPITVVLFPSPTASDPITISPLAVGEDALVLAPM